MQTNLASFIKDTPEGEEADSILRKCVHCGFCLATCPSYSLSQNELDSPRGRIYLIKQLLEGEDATEKTRSHLETCLQCRSCETTCPSNVQYHRLLEIATPLVENRAPLSLSQKALRASIVYIMPYASRFTPILRIGQFLRPLLPTHLQKKLPSKTTSSPKTISTSPHKRHMLILEGCVQPGLAPNINSATERVLDRFGITLIKASKAGCCGALSYHQNKQEDGKDFMRKNIDAWWPFISESCEAIVITASGCGTTIKEYGHILKDDSLYAAKAQKVSELAKDLSEIFSDLPLEQISLSPEQKIAFHCPCSLQHAQGLSGSVEAILQRLGFSLTPVRDAHMCCGSAGTYSIFQPEAANELRDRKIESLEQNSPDAIATANIGCQVHLNSASSKPVRHWIELIDEALS